jgi:hypothetical protein
MPAYVRLSLPDFVAADPVALAGQLEQGHAQDGYATQFSLQTKAWKTIIPLLQQELRRLLDALPRTAAWTLLLEFPLYRLRRRIDAILLTERVIVVVEMKIGEQRFSAEDARQVEEYALDLRDFHADSHDRPLLPVLWCPSAPTSPAAYVQGSDLVAPVQRIGSCGLSDLLASIPLEAPGNPIVADTWDNARYRPVPNVIEAATTLFAGHEGHEILHADATNLREAAARLVELIGAARDNGHRALLFLTGVPGSGKTLAGLRVVHDAITTGQEARGDIVYLSGNTPLVAVLREALAQDEHQRLRQGEVSRPLRDIRRDVRGRVQHITDFLRDNLSADSSGPPHEHAIVFDEAQRAWDAEQGQKKFGRDASEPALLLGIMSRHNWCACVCLLGGGQEINTGEQGVAGWSEALRQLPTDEAARWHVYAPADALHGGPTTAGASLGPIPAITLHEDPALQLLVPMRSFRSERVSAWVAAVIAGDASEAAAIASQLGHYPVMLTRSLEVARDWLRRQGRGTRRYGLVASSTASRLRADGLGEILRAGDGDAIAHWYLKPPGDIRSSFALEVPANEYTCQGLELDFVGVCWGGDLVFSPTGSNWLHRRLSGSRWNGIQDESARRLLRNKYRVLLTRAREGMILWVPRGDPNDATRDPAELDATAGFLQRCGAQLLPDQISAN